jgi:hypothetical protein
MLNDDIKKNQLKKDKKKNTWVNMANLQNSWAGLQDHDNPT